MIRFSVAGGSCDSGWPQCESFLQGRDSIYYPLIKESKDDLLLPNKFSGEIIGKVDGQYGFTNKRSGIKIGYVDGILDIKSLATGTEPIKLRLERYGDKIINHHKSDISSISNDLELLTVERPEITEWFRNSTTGVEQGFTIQKPKTKIRDIYGITYNILSGNQKVRLNNNATELTWSDGSGKVLYSFNGLRAFDSRGISLKASYETTKNKLSININVVNVAWPITVDPIISSPIYEEQVIKEPNFSLYTSGFGTSIASDKDKAIAVSGSGIYAFERVNNTWSYTQKIASTSFAGDDGNHPQLAAMHNNTAVIGIPSQNRAFVYEYSLGKWNSKQIITPPNPKYGDLFGSSVDIHGNNLIIGSPGADPDDGKGGQYVDAGTIYIYKLNSDWSQVASYVYPSNYAAFGASVAIWDNAGVAVIRRPPTPVNGVTPAAIPATFIFDGANWSFQSILQRSYSYPSSIEVSVDMDDKQIVLGDAYNNVVTIWRNNGANWLNINELTASDGISTDLFGIDVALEDRFLLVGSARSYFNNIGYAGSAYAFFRGLSGWTEFAKFIATDRSESDWFGRAVALSNNIPMIASHHAEDQGYFQNGHVYSYKLPLLLDIYKAGDGSGVVTATPAGYFSGINCGTLCFDLYDLGESVNLYATPDLGSYFQEWVGCDFAGGNQCTVSMDQAKSVYATFTLGSQPINYTLQVEKNGGGVISSNPFGIDCGNDCSNSYSRDDVVTLTAVPDSGWHFSGWGGACSGTGSCVVTMSGNINVTATFILNPAITHTLNYYTAVSQFVNGGNTTLSFNPSGLDCGSNCKTYPENTLVTLTASSSFGYNFTGWSGDCWGANPCVLSMTANKSVTANFNAATTKRLSVSKTGSGSIISNPAGIDCGNTCSYDFTNNFTVSLIPNPEKGFTFVGWGGACSGRGGCSVYMGSDQSVTAKFVNTFVLIQPAIQLLLE